MSGRPDSQCHDAGSAPLSRELLTRTPGVCGGELRIAGTRIAVWGIEHARRVGASDSEIMEMYPTVASDQLVAACRYADEHPDEMDRLIAENDRV